MSASPIKRVWIEAGCISCSLCADICPQVFDVPDGEDCVIRPEANRHFESMREDIVTAAQDCPVEVIQYADGSQETEETAGVS